MPTLVFLACLLLIAFGVRALRSRQRLRTARWVLWLGFLLGFLSLKAGWMPTDPYTLAGLLVYFLYLIIQDLRLQKVARKSTTV